MDKMPNGGRTAPRSRASTLFRFVVTCGLLVAAAGAAAQPQDNDYYKARLTKEGADLLRKVEGYHLKQGMDKMRAGSYAYAYGDFDFILRYFPNHPQGLALITELCDVRWKNDRCDSEARLRKAIELNPRAPQTYVVYGVHLQRLKRTAEAVESYKRAIELDPAAGNAHYNLGLIYLEQKEFELANRHAQLAYATGMPYPALRDRLTQAGQWKPMDADALKRELASPAAKHSEASPK